MQQIYCFAKGRATDSGAGFPHSLDDVGRSPSNLGAQVGRHAPLMGTNGGDAAVRKSSYFVGRTRQGGFKVAGLPAHAKLLRIHHNSFRRG